MNEKISHKKAQKCDLCFLWLILTGVEMEVNRRRTLLMIAGLVLTFIVLRIYLHNSPNTDLNIGQYNIHHLYTGLLLITLGGIPLVNFQGEGRILDLSALVFGIGLSMA